MVYDPYWWGWGWPYAYWGWPYPYWDYPYYGYYPYDPYYAYGPQVYIEQAPAGYWYYCASARGYYPTVSTCPEPWIRVAPRPGDTYHVGKKRSVSSSITPSARAVATMGAPS